MVSRSYYDALNKAQELSKLIPSNPLLLRSTEDLRRRFKLCVTEVASIIDGSKTGDAGFDSLFKELTFLYVVLEDKLSLDFEHLDKISNDRRMVSKIYNLSLSVLNEQPTKILIDNPDIVSPSDMKKIRELHSEIGMITFSLTQEESYILYRVRDGLCELRYES